MDPVTQGVVGATASQLVSERRDKALAALVGWFAGMAADLDVLIRSSTDPLLALEYHRQFTHSLAFIPFGALFCAAVFFFLVPTVKRSLTFSTTYLFCFAGYVTHAVLDACTTYGTQLFWPFSDARFAWNNVSVVDPLFTLPLVLLLILSVRKQSTKIAVFAACYALFYLSLGLLQQQRAEAIAIELIEARGHTPINHGLKPSLGNIITWKSVYEHNGRYYVDAVRVLKAHRVIPGSSTEKLELSRHFPWLQSDTQQAKDVARFGWFSNQHLALDPQNPQRIIDVRYSLLPNRLDGMWGIILDPAATPDQHVRWTTTRPNQRNVPEHLKKLWAMVVR
ncbi:MAG: metal-dependent hydrolase [Gammaproteobacteria bacterium]|nr:metal-dependent hydrolase [Gammaproteobacteria bacterium]